jgi:hypothetical protein
MWWALADRTAAASAAPESLEWAAALAASSIFEATKRSYELIAREVFPHFQGQHHSTMRAAIRAQKMRPDLAIVHAKAVETAQAIYASEKAARAAAE